MKRRKFLKLTSQAAAAVAVASAGVAQAAKSTPERLKADIAMAGPPRHGMSMINETLLDSLKRLYGPEYELYGKDYVRAFTKKP